METLSPSPARPQRAAAAEGPNSAQRKNQSPDSAADTGGPQSAAGFSQLLKSAGERETQEVGSNGLLELPGLQQFSAGVPSAMVLPDVQHPMLLPFTESVPVDVNLSALLGQGGGALMSQLGVSSQEGVSHSLSDSDLAWSLHSLVGQTTRLDQSADVSLRNGTYLQARMDAGDSLALTLGAHVAELGGAAHVPVVAQGVMAAGSEGLAQPALQVASMTRGMNLAVDALQTTVDSVVEDAFTGEGVGGLESGNGSDGRVALQGQWTTAERAGQAAETMQRLLGQMSQFLSATGAVESAGIRRSGAKSADDATVPAQDIASMQSGTALGTGRLMEQAVAQSAAAQQAHNGDSPAAPAEPEVAYWMNARQQRAEVVLDRDGEPVRVQVMLEGNTAHVTFRSDEQATRSMLDASIAQLRDMLAAQGVELAGVQVNTQTNAQTNSGQGDGVAGQERFIPEGARRMRLATEDPVQPGLAGYQGRVSHQGIDIFA